MERLQEHLKRRSGKRKLVSSTIAAFGLLWLVVEPAGLFLPDQFRWGWPGFLGLLILSVIVGLWRARPINVIERELPPSDLTVAIRVGDVLYPRGGNVVIGTNDCFDTDLDDSIISSASVQGQLLQTVFRGDRGSLDNQIRQSVGAGIHDPAKAYGKRERYSIGTVAVVHYGGSRYFLPAFTKMSETLPAHVHSSVEWLQIALARTWREINAAGQREPVHVPIVGSNLARLGVSRTLLIQMIILSYIAATTDTPSSSLTVWVSSKDAKVVDMAVLDDWLRGICAA